MLRSLFGLLVIIVPIFAADKWIRVKTDNFELITTAGEGRAKDTLRDFERVSSFFEQALNRPVKPDVPLRIVLFKNEKEFQQYRFNEVAAAYYQPGPDRDYIVMYPSSEQGTRTAIHEFVHLLAKHSNPKSWPIWLNEGVAELYSTMRPIGNKILIGGLIEGHIVNFRQEKPIPLRDLLAADHSSALYNRKRHAGMLYAESWALTHMLQLEPGYRDNFPKVLQLLSEDRDSVTALEAAFSKPLVSIQKDLDAYMRGNSFFGVTFDLKLASKIEVDVDTPPPGDVTVTLAALMASAHRMEEAETMLNAEIAKEPKDPALHVAKGFLHYRTAKFDQARLAFREAYTLGTTNVRVLRDLARMSYRDDVPTAIGAFQRILQQGDAPLETKMMLADLYLRQKQYGAAYSAVSGVGKVAKEDAYRLFRIRAAAEDGLGQPTALETAKRAQQYAPDDNKDYIDRYVRYLEQKREYASRKVELVQQQQQEPEPVTDSRPSFITDDEGAPVVQRRYRDAQGRTVEEASMPKHVSPQGKGLLELRGKFTQLVCQGEQAIAVLQTGTSTSTKLVILDPNRLIASDKGKAMILELTCGQQQNRDVIVWWEEAPHAATKSVGVLWEFHFQ